MLGAVLVYILFFNILFIFSDSISFDADPVANNNQDINIGFGDSIEVTTSSKRFYGTIEGSGTIDRNYILKIFGFIPLPYLFNEINFRYFHMASFGVFFISWLIGLLRPQQGFERGEY